MVDLPVKNENGYFEIRMEAIGGMGANLAGKMLAEAAVIHMGLNGATFSSYGSEKTGTPLKAFIRLGPGDEEIAIGGPVLEPHILAVFHTILRDVLPVTSGLVKDGTIIVNSKMTPQEVKDYFDLPGGHVYVLDCEKIVLEEKVKINTVMMGAIAKASNFIEPEAAKKAISNALQKFGDKTVNANIRGFDRAMKEMQYEHFPWPDDMDGIPVENAPQKIGYMNAPMGGAILNTGNSVSRDVSGSRSGMIPVHNLDNCTHCSFCEIACPDFCFIFESDTDDKGNDVMFNRGIDYKFCKGCLKCVAVCPSNALTSEKEAEQDLAVIGKQKTF
ncbi:MAG: 2-oxoacid:acceptor oxidoreductase family protein [bacterium]